MIQLTLVVCQLGNFCLCSVLDLDAFERINKAEGLGMSSDACSGEKNLEDAATTCKLFRFLQLLCEGHNLGMSDSPSSLSNRDTEGFRK